MTPIFCAYCGEDITELIRKKRHYSSNSTSKKSYCDKDCRANADKRDGHFKTMSLAGKQGRIKSLQEKPRKRGKKSVD